MLRKERSRVDQDRCLGVIAEVVDENCRELDVISRGLGLCEGTLCSNVAEVGTWVLREMAAQQRMVLRMMEALSVLGKAVHGSRRAHCAEERVVEGVSEVSGGHNALKADASAVERDGTGSALGGSLAGAPGMQAEVCEVDCDSVDGVVVGTPD